MSMKALYFDCFSGISGDMTLGALLDLGIECDKFIKELNKLEIDEYKFEIRTVYKNGIKGTDVNILVNGENDNSNCASLHDDMHNHGHYHEHGRNMADIRNLINKSGLNAKVKGLSIKIFEEIAAAEAKVHGKETDDVHFHEVGAVDSIIDIVGVAICLDILGIERVYSSPLHDGTGFIKCKHGVMPVPVPAVMEMLAGSGIPLITEDIQTELVTPTGMGIIKCISSKFGAMPQMKVEKVGYGMGKRDTGKFNALRVLLGEVDEEEEKTDEIVVLETNIDDMSSEILGYVMDKLMKNGAYDVFYTPVYMKKNRPAYMLTVLAGKDNEQRMADILFRETTTLGIRKTYTERYIMDRETLYVETGYGKVRMKKGHINGITKLAPEFEDCRKIAEDQKVPLKDIYEAAVRAAQNVDK